MYKYIYVCIDGQVYTQRLTSQFSTLDMVFVKCGRTSIKLSPPLPHILFSHPSSFSFQICRFCLLFTYFFSFKLLLLFISLFVFLPNWNKTLILICINMIIYCGYFILPPLVIANMMLPKIAVKSKVVIEYVLDIGQPHNCLKFNRDFKGE